MNVTIAIDTRGALEALKVSAQSLRAATAEAVTSTVTASREEAARRIAEQLRVPIRSTSFAVTVDRGRASESLSASIRIIRLLVPVRKLSPVQTPTGVAYSGPGGTFGELRHAFIATLRRGGTGGGGAGAVGVFRRTTRPAERRGPNRSYLPIKQQVAIVKPFVPDGLIPWMTARLVEDLRRQLFFRGHSAPAGSITAARVA